MDDNKPLVSVILPTHNRAKLLERAVRSVLVQTYTNLELIVVNDASTDHTREVLAAIDDPRLRVIHRELNQGAAAARNAGIATARGEFVAFQDDDDYWLVQKLEKQMQALEGVPDAGWCLSSYIRLEPRMNEYVGGSYYINQLDYAKGIGTGGPDWSLIATPGWLVRRNALQSVGAFDERIRSWDDWELGLRLSKACRRIVVDEPLWVQDWHRGGGLTRAERVRADDMRIILSKHGNMWARRRRALARHYYVIGRAESLYDADPKAGREMLFRSIRTFPLRYMSWAALVLSYMRPDVSRRFTAYLRERRERARR